MPAIVFDRISLDREGVFALNGVSLEIEDGELLTVVGPSGSGKTALLRIIAGLEQPSGGRLLFDGTDMIGAEPLHRDVAMVFQEHALYSHKTAEANLAFPLEVHHVQEPERTSRVAKMATAMRLARILDRLPKTLSIGQRNAVATGRALVRDPAILLLDEPLANFDARARLHARVEIRERHDQSGATTIYATNDQAEAMALGDRVVVLNRGTLQQIGPPELIYGEPANLFVARFVGTPPMNAMTGLFEAVYPDFRWSSGDDRLVIPTRIVESRPRLREFTGRRIVIGIRPQHVHPTVAAPSGTWMRGTCLRIEDHGSDRFAHVELGSGQMVARIGEQVPGIGTSTELAVDVERLHFFDPETGAAV